jgi:hypothetical protein
MNERTLTFRLPETEFLILTRYAAATRRTKSDIVREFIRSLEPMTRASKNPKPKATKRKAAP